MSMTLINIVGRGEKVTLADGTTELRGTISITIVGPKLESYNREIYDFVRALRNREFNLAENNESQENE